MRHVFVVSKPRLSTITFCLHEIFNVMDHTTSGLSMIWFRSDFVAGTLVSVPARLFAFGADETFMYVAPLPRASAIALHR